MSQRLVLQVVHTERLVAETCRCDLSSSVSRAQKHSAILAKNDSQSLKLNGTKSIDKSTVCLCRFISLIIHRESQVERIEENVSYAMINFTVLKPNFKNLLITTRTYSYRIVLEIEKIDTKKNKNMSSRRTIFLEEKISHGSMKVQI